MRITNQFTRKLPGTPVAHKATKARILSCRQRFGYGRHADTSWRLVLETLAPPKPRRIDVNTHQINTKGNSTMIPANYLFGDLVDRREILFQATGFEAAIIRARAEVLGIQRTETTASRGLAPT